MRYSFSVLLRRNMVLLKNCLRKKSNLSFFSTLMFIFSYTLYTFIRSEKTIRIKIKNGSHINLRPNSSDLEVFIQHYVYNELFTLKPKIASDIKYILDAGANIGITALVLSELFPESKIVAIELEKENYKLLTINCKKLIENNRVIPLLGAFYPDNNTQFSIQKNALGEWAYSLSPKKNGENQTASVEIITYEAVCNLLSNTQPDLIKMDIEGSEIDFFKSGAVIESILNNSLLLVELHGFNAYYEYFNLLKQNSITSGFQIGEFWVTKPPKK